MTKCVTVTGGAGFIGVPVVRRLLADGWEVTALDSFITGDRGRLPDDSHLSIVEGDIRTPDAVDEALHGASVVIHLAAMHFVPWCDAHPAETLDTNIVGFQRVLDGCERAEVQRVVFTSTAAVYAPSSRAHRESSTIGPDNLYGHSKLFGESLVHAWADTTGGDAMIARLFNVYGPGETNPHLIPDIIGYLRAGDDLSLGNADSCRDYVHVDDVAAALVALATHSGGRETVNVGTGHAANATDIVGHLREITGRRLRILQDAARVRPTDRPFLQADVDHRDELLSDVTFRPLEQGLRSLVVGESVGG